LSLQPVERDRSSKAYGRAGGVSIAA
jgi:hypothetical protein